MEMTNYTAVGAVLRNNYRLKFSQSHWSLLLLGNKTKKFVTRPFLAGRRARAGHETNVNYA